MEISKFLAVIEISFKLLEINSDKRIFHGGIAGQRPLMKLFLPPRNSREHASESLGDVKKYAASGTFSNLLPKGLLERNDVFTISRI
jgi:hypothetical protein